MQKRMQKLKRRSEYRIALDSCGKKDEAASKQLVAPEKRDKKARDRAENLAEAQRRVESRDAAAMETDEGYD